MIRTCVLVLALGACGGGTDGSLADASLDPDAEPDAEPDATPPFVLSGTVVDGDFLPVSGQTVLAVATGETAATDGAGHFTLPGVTAPPYDLAVWDPAAVSGGVATPAATIYLGLTRPDPIIVMFTSHPQHRYGTADVTVSAGFPSSDHIEVLDAPELSSGTSSSAGNAFSYMSTWSGPASTTGVIRSFVQTRDGAGLTTAVTRYGATSPITLMHTLATSSILTYGGAPPTATISGTATFPPADTIRLDQRVQFGPGTALQQGTAASAGAYSFLVPDVAGATHVVCGSATLDTGFDPPRSVRCAGDLAAGTTGVTLDVPPWIDAVSPAADVVAARSGPFTWTVPAGGISILHVAPQVAGNPHFFVVTASATATIPSLEFSIPSSPSGTQYAWRVYGYPAVATVDDAATTSFPRGTGILGPSFVRPLWGASLQVTKSESRFFTTP